MDLFLIVAFSLIFVCVDLFVVHFYEIVRIYVFVKAQIDDGFTFLSLLG